MVSRSNVSGFVEMFVFHFICVRDMILYNIFNGVCVAL